MSELGKQLGYLFAIIIVISAVLLIFGVNPSPQPQSVATNALPTAPTEQQLQQLQSEPATFQSLVSYTDRGFQPAALSVGKGNTVRFVNNSSGPLWVASIGTGTDEIYPGNSSCGGSEFDSCGPMSPKEYWEFTFDQSGTWQFQNNANTSDVGVITVTVK